MFVGPSLGGWRDWLTFRPNGGREMKFKVSTKECCYTKQPDRVIKDIRRRHFDSRFYKKVVAYNDIVDLSYLAVKERVLVIAIQNRGSFEKKVLCNAYTRVE